MTDHLGRGLKNSENAESCTWQAVVNKHSIKWNPHLYLQGIKTNI